MPRVSVLVAAYNAGDYIAETIESVRGQDFTDWELVVCDDGSTDSTSAIVRAFMASDARIQLIRQENSGAPAARNTAYGKSTGEYIVILDADDRLLPDKLRIQVELLDRHPRVGLVYGDTWFCDEAGTRLQLESVRFPGQHRQGDVFAAVCCGNMMAVHSAMVRRSAIDAAGGVHHPTQMQIADWDLWVRIAENAPFLYHPEPVADYRLHQSMSARVDSGLKQIRQREFNLARIEQLGRFSALSRREKACIYFAQARFCIRWRSRRLALHYFGKALACDPWYGRAYLGLIAGLFGK